MTQGREATHDRLHPAEAAARQRVLFVRLARAVYFVLIITITLLAILRPAQDDLSKSLAQQWWSPLLVAVALFCFAVIVDLLTPRKKIATLFGVMLGVLVGMLATVALGFVAELMLKSWMEDPAFRALMPVVSTMKLLLGITLSYLGVTTVLQTQDDFRLAIPYVEFSKQLRGVRSLLLDTSVLIDGRIVDVASTGIIQSPLVIHRSVIDELQLLADNADGLTRGKGRRGLDLISRLQRMPRLDVSIDESSVQSKSVDQALIELARTMDATILTTDSGLARVAGIQGASVVNLHELAAALKTSLVAGEVVALKLLRPGEQPGQAVGYMPDGTMVVAEDGGPRVGDTVQVCVTSSLQTSAGRLIFARLHGPDAPAPVDPGEAPPEPTPAPAPSTAAEAAVEAEKPDGVKPARSPFPPKPPQSMRTGTPRNPRR